MDARAIPAGRRATYRDIIDAPPHMVAEIIDGELHLSPRPAPPHARASSQIMVGVGGRFGLGSQGPGGPGEWWILFEPELHFGEEVVVPDLAGWHQDRMPSLPKEAAFRLAPDWVCEVLSPSTAGFDRVRKMAVYAREGVDYLWLVDPIGRTVEVYRLTDGQWLVAGTFAGNAEIRAEPFETEAFDMSAWWWTSIEVRNADQGP